MAVRVRGTSTPNPPPERRVFQIADLDRRFMRRVVDSAKLAALKASIEKEGGLLELPHVAPDGTLVSGQMRVECLVQLGHTDVECLVYPHLTTRLLQLKHIRTADTKSDVSRHDQALRVLLVKRDCPGIKQCDIAAATGDSTATISRLCDLLDLADDLLDAVFADRLKLQHVIAVAKVKDPTEKATLLRQALAEGWTAKELGQRLTPRRGGNGGFSEIRMDGVVLRYPKDGWDAARLEQVLTRLKEYVGQRAEAARKAVKSLPLSVILRAKGGDQAEGEA